MKLIFSRSRSISSYLIRLLTVSTWSHVAIVDGEHVIDSMRGHGVRRRTLASFLAAFPEHLVVEVQCARDWVGIDYAASQVGKPYDYVALVGWMLPGRMWEHDRAWFCSELAAAALVRADHYVGGTHLPSEADRITPGLLLEAIHQAAAGAAQ